VRMFVTAIVNALTSNLDHDAPGAGTTDALNLAILTNASMSVSVSAIVPTYLDHIP